MHWIQAKKSHEPDQPVISVKVTDVRDDGHIEIEGTDLKLELWHHRSLRSRLAVGTRVQWKPRFHVLYVPGYGHFNVATPDRVQPCVTPGPETLSTQRTARHTVKK